MNIYCRYWQTVRNEDFCVSGGCIAHCVWNENKKPDLRAKYKWESIEDVENYKNNVSESIFSQK